MTRALLLLLLACGGIDQQEDLPPQDLPALDLCDPPPASATWCPADVWEYGGRALCVGAAACDFYADWQGKPVRISCVPKC